MKLLTPLGLLGLLGILVLIIIYIIRPNYQQKYISSTFIWKLSLKYKKKKLPTSKLRNILLIICQILILALCAAILSKPATILQALSEDNEVILIIDSSSSMRAFDETGTSRFMRAIDEVTFHANEVLDNNGYVTVILADEKPEILVDRINKEKAHLLNEELDPLYLDADYACSYGTSDINSAVEMCTNIFADNPTAHVYVYTDSDYAAVPNNITIKNVAEVEEWNAAILSAEGRKEDNYYMFEVEVACYNRDATIVLNMDVENANALSKHDKGVDLSFKQEVVCTNDETVKVIFLTNAHYESIGNKEADGYVYCIMDESDVSRKIFSYKSIYLYLEEVDNYTLDNNFSIFGGQKEVVNVLYLSADTNNFFRAALQQCQSRFRNNWDIKLDIPKVGTVYDPTIYGSGYDFYIFEHTMPTTLPQDGVVMLVNPENNLPSGTGAQKMGQKTYDTNIFFAPGNVDHMVMQNIIAGDLFVQRYYRLMLDEEYHVLMTCESNPIFAVKNTEQSKIIMMPFSLHYSNLALEGGYFPLLMFNIFRYYFPATVDGYAFEVGESVTMNARGTSLSVNDSNNELIDTYKSFPTQLKLSTPGPYSLTQTLYNGTSMTEQIYVNPPAYESNICREETTLTDPYVQPDMGDLFADWLLYLAAGLVAFLFLEWWLQSRDNM